MALLSDDHTQLMPGILISHICFLYMFVFPNSYWYVCISKSHLNFDRCADGDISTITAHFRHLFINSKIKPLYISGSLWRRRLFNANIWIPPNFQTQIKAHTNQHICKQAYKQTQINIYANKQTDKTYKQTCFTLKLLAKINEVNIW